MKFQIRQNDLGTCRLYFKSKDWHPLWSVVTKGSSFSDYGPTIYTDFAFHLALGGISAHNFESEEAANAAIAPLKEHIQNRLSGSKWKTISEL